MGSPGGDIDLNFLEKRIEGHRNRLPPRRNLANGANAKAGEHSTFCRRASGAYPRRARVLGLLRICPPARPRVRPPEQLRPVDLIQAVGHPERNRLGTSLHARNIAPESEPLCGRSVPAPLYNAGILSQNWLQGSSLSTSAAIARRAPNRGNAPPS